MRHPLRSLAAVFVVAMAIPLVAQPSPAKALFHEGLLLERAEGRMQDAIFRYERVIAEFPKDVEIAPQALYHLALVYERLKDPRATLMLTRLVTEYPNAGSYAADARAKLAATQAAPAGPFRTRVLDPKFESGSPDGKFVIYHKNDDFSRLYLRDLASGAERLLVELDGFVSNFAWSPDSRRIAFNYQRDTGTPTINDIRIVTVATGEIRALAVRGYPFAWTTVGDVFFYRVNYAANAVDWWLVASTGGEPRIIISASNSDGGFAAISPNGASLLVYRKEKLALVDIATGAERLVTTTSAKEERPMFSPDGRLVAFASNPDGPWALYVVPLDRIPVRAPLRAASLDPAAVNPATQPARAWWTEDGVLTLPVRRAESNVFRIAMDKATGHAVDAPQRLTQDTPQNSWPVVSPDGKYIAYNYRGAATGGIAVMDADGANERPLVDLKGSLPISWRAPDEILFYDFATAVGQKPAITSLNVKTGARQPVAQVEGLYWHYVNARKEILHSHPGGGGPKPGLVLKARSLVDGTDRIVATIDYLMPRIAVSPDGRRFAYGVSRDLIGASPQCEVSIMTLDGVREKVLIPMRQPCMAPGPAAWSPDGRFLALGTAQGLFVFNVETGESWPLRADLPSSPAWGQGSWAPDGSFVVLTQSSNRTERLAWEGVTYDAVMRLMAARDRQ